MGMGGRPQWQSGAPVSPPFQQIFHSFSHQSISHQFQPMGYSGSSPGNYGPPGSGGSAGGGNNGGGGPPGPSTPIMPSPQDSSNSGGENIYTMMKPEFPMGGPPGGGGPGNGGPVGSGPDGGPGPANGGPPGGGPGGAPVGGPGEFVVVVERQEISF